MGLSTGASLLTSTADCLVSVAGTSLPLRRIALEAGEFMRVLHPADTLGELDLDPRRHRVRVVVSGALHVDDAGQHLGIGVEQAGPQAPQNCRRPWAEEA